MKRLILAALVGAAVTYAWLRHRKFVHEFDDQGG